MPKLSIFRLLFPTSLLKLNCVNFVWMGGSFVCPISIPISSIFPIFETLRALETITWNRRYGISRWFQNCDVWLGAAFNDKTLLLGEQSLCISHIHSLYITVMPGSHASETLIVSDETNLLQLWPKVSGMIFSMSRFIRLFEYVTILVKRSCHVPLYHVIF